MTTKRLLEKVRELMDMDKQQQKDKRDKLRKLLKKIKHRQRALEDELEKTKKDKQRNKIERDLKVLHAQRKKGIKICRAIKCKKD